jgi:uncharacterized membrane protein
MKHVALAFLVLVLTIAGGAVLWWNRAHVTTPVLVFSGCSFIVAVGLAFPTNLKAALEAIGSAKVPKIGGTP